MQQHVGTNISPCVFWPLNVCWMSEEETQQVGTSTCWCSWCSSWCFCAGRLCWKNLNLKHLPHVSVWSAASCLICVAFLREIVTIFIAALMCSFSQTKIGRSVPVSSNRCWSLSQAIWRLTLRSWRFCGATWVPVFSRCFQQSMETQKSFVQLLALIRYLVANYPQLVFVGYNPSDLHGISRVNPLITGVITITHLLSGMSHPVDLFRNDSGHSFAIHLSGIFYENRGPQDA